MRHFTPGRLLLDFETLRVRERIRWLKSGLPVKRELVVEGHVPRSAIAFERLDVMQPRFRARQSELLLEDSRAGTFGMLEVVQLVVGKKPTALVVVLRHVRVTDEQDLVLGKHRYVGDQRVDSAFRLHGLNLSVTCDSHTATRSEITCSGRAVA